MAVFTYKAIDRAGKVQGGTLEASSLETASRSLRTQGLTVVQLTAGGVINNETASESKGATRDQILSFTNELSVLLRAGLPIDRALKVLIDMSAVPAMTGLLENLLKTVKGGKGLSQAMAAHEHAFGPFYINMVRSGEASGRLAEVLASLAEYLTRVKALRSSVISALIYPIILAVVAILSVMVMLGYVVPQFEALFEDMGDGLPLLTRWIVAAGNGVKAWGWLMAIVVGLFIWQARRWLSTESGRAWRDNKALKLPFIGSMLFKYEVGRFSRTLGTLLSNGVALLPALSIAMDTVENSSVKHSFEGLPKAIKGGGRLSIALAEAGTFSPLVVQMVRVGEESGSLDAMMLELAVVYDDEVQSGIKRVLTLLEPILILGMGAVIAVIIIAILMGILSVNDLAT